MILMPKVVPEYKEQARKRIIIEALKVFSEKGYYRTKMKDIATNIGVSKAAIYQYFKTKNELL
ncbi:MAG: TetR/AcrR family transcriptional regulator, partial [Promethearchaeota archaeon]